MSSAFTGEGKTDAKDAHIIAETVPLRRDLSVIDQITDLARNLPGPTAHRADLVADRVRGINRLRDLMTSAFPAWEREFDYASCKGALVLVSGYATPDRLRRVGQTRLAAWFARPPRPRLRSTRRAGCYRALRRRTWFASSDPCCGRIVPGDAAVEQEP